MNRVPGDATKVLRAGAFDPIGVSTPPRYRTAHGRGRETHVPSSRAGASSPRERPRRRGRSLPMDEKSEQGGAAWDVTQWHVVQKGDTLSKIAEQYYGDANLYPKIFDANRDVIKDPNVIRIGQKLRIP